MLTDFQNSFTVRFTGKFATKSSLTILPHLNCVTALLCEISLLKNCSAQDLSVEKLMQNSATQNAAKNSLQ